MESVEEFEKNLKEQIEKGLNHAQSIGIQIGWNAFAIRAIENIKDMNSVDEIKAYFQDEADRTKEKLNLEDTTVNIKTRS